MEEIHMTVLMIIGAIAALVLLAVFIGRTNEYTQRVYRYAFFTWQSLAITGAGYAFLLFGKNWYVTEMAKQGDLLNGIILMAIGVWIIYYVVRKNIEKTSLKFGLLFSVVQLILYIPATYMAIFVIMIIFIALAQTRPVYNIN